MMLFCSRLIRPSTASSRNWILLPRNDGVVRQRLHVAQRRLEAVALVLRQRRGSALCCTYIRMRWKLTRLSRAFETRSPSAPIWRISACRSALLGEAAPPRGKIANDTPSSSVCTRSSRSAIRSTNASSRPANSVADDVHAAGERSTNCMKRCTGRRVDVAVGDHPPVGEDERDRAALRALAVELAADRRRHVDGAAFLVEAVRGLDLLHLVARGHVDGEQRLDGALFLGGRLEQVGPEELVRKRRRRAVLDPGVAAAGGDQ